ncbi:MAG: helix-turn-helix transcriptional regulator [Pseudomonadota bacterium]
MPNLSTSRQNPALVSLGDALRQLRKERGMSQDALALQADVDRSYVGQIERGDNNVAVLTLIKLASALGVKVSELMLIAGI